MQEQPPFILCQAFALVASLTYLYYLLNKKPTTSCCINMNEPRFQVGVIVEKPVIDKAFYEDCVDSLKSIGFKKSQATVIAKKVFANNNPDSIQSFISLAMQYK